MKKSVTLLLERKIKPIETESEIDKRKSNRIKTLTKTSFLRQANFSNLEKHQRSLTINCFNSYFKIKPKSVFFNAVRRLYKLRICT